MLKITRETTATPEAAATRLNLEGQIAGQWVDELRRTCGDVLRGGTGRVVLDLQEVSFIDGEGLQLLREIWDQVAVTNCSLFAAEQLKELSAEKQMGRS